MNDKPDMENPLRKKGEAQITGAPLEQAYARNADELQREFEVYQTEGKMQNEERRRAHPSPQESRDRYVDLYELAPVGYLTLTDTGLIAETNLAGAALLGKTRQSLANFQFANFVAAEDSDRWRRLFLGALRHKDRQNCELTLEHGDGRRIQVRLDCMQAARTGETPQIRIILTDITESRQAERAIRKSEERLSAIVDQVMVGIGQSDLEGRITFVNDHFFRITGYSREELTGMRWQDLTHPDDLPQNMSFFEKILREDKPFSFEKRYLRKNGETVWVEIGASVLHGLGGQPTGVLAVVVDISARKQAEALLKKSSDEFEDLYNHAPCGYHSLDRDGVIVRINDTELDWLGYAREEVLGRMKVTDFYTPVSRQLFLEQFPQFLRQGAVHGLEKDMVRRDGTVFTVLIHATAIYDSNGDFLTSRSMLQDITERKAAENALAKSEERARLAISVSHLALWDYDLVTGSVYLSEEWSKLLGGERQPTYTTIQALTELVPEEEREMVRTAILGVVKGADSSLYQVTHRVRKLDGEYIWVQSEGHVTDRHPDGRALRMIGINRDITERKRLEKEVLERRNEMEELQKLHTASQTAAAIAHELNQPLLAIASYNEAALMLLRAEHPNLDKIRKAVEASELQAHRAGQSIRELLEFLSIKEFPTESMDLNREIVDLLDVARSEHELKFHAVLHLAEGLPPVRVNRNHLHKVLVNLLRNGIEAMQEAGVPLPAFTVTVRTLKDRSDAQVSIQDNGPGFRKEDLQHLFKPFFSTKAGGVGMGLAISRALIEANGGQLWVDPQEGPGATLHLTLPFAT